MPNLRMSAPGNDQLSGVDRSKLVFKRNCIMKFAQTWQRIRDPDSEPRP